MYLDDIRAYIPQTPAEEADKKQILSYVNQFPDTILTRENPIAHITASGFILSRDGKWVLMAHHNIFQVWAWTGGHADGEGDLLAVALREAREETGAGHILPLSPRHRLGGDPTRLGPCEAGKICLCPPASQCVLSSHRRPGQPPHRPGGGEHQSGLAPGGQAVGADQRVADG